MKSEAMKTCLALLAGNPQVSDYKVNICKKESFELYFVKGALETARSTDTCDRVVTVYADHDGFRGDAQFSVYPSSEPQELRAAVEEAVRNALLICNPGYTLPRAQTEEHVLSSNLADTPLPVLAKQAGQAVFDANTLEGGSLNSVEVFVNHYRETVCNSQGLEKTQERWEAMVEAIPTFNGSKESVELYEQYHFSTFCRETLMEEIRSKMEAVRERYKAVRPDFSLDCPVVLHKLELNDLFSAIAGDLNYATVYSHGNLLQKGDRLQKEVHGDPITLTMRGQVAGNTASARFDTDGLSLGEITPDPKGNRGELLWLQPLRPVSEGRSHRNLRLPLHRARQPDPAPGSALAGSHEHVRPAGGFLQRLHRRRNPSGLLP